MNLDANEKRTAKVGETITKKGTLFNKVTEVKISKGGWIFDYKALDEVGKKVNLSTSATILATYTIYENGKITDTHDYTFFKAGTYTISASATFISSSQKEKIVLKTNLLEVIIK